MRDDRLSTASQTKRSKAAKFLQILEKRVASDKCATALSATALLIGWILRSCVVLLFKA
jgi:hypothetical protein